MKELTFYEQVGIVIPGALLIFGLIFFFPDLRQVLTKDGITVGGFGVIVLISYAAGHLLAALGNLIEGLFWKLNGGMPSNWIVGPKPRLLTPSQITKVEALAKSRLGLSIAPFSEQTTATWFPIFRQIYSDVEMHGKPNRGDTFNGNYGLNRGLAAATFSLSLVGLIQHPGLWYVSIGLFCIGLVFIYRMQRFGVLYAREIYNQFLLLPEEPGTTGTPKKQRQSNKLS